jgi:hypothetical protein
MSDYEEVPANDILDRWFSSDTWKQICCDSEQGCKDSIHLMEQINDQLTSLIFHLKNDSSSARVKYDINWFVELCEDFGVA